MTVPLGNETQRYDHIRGLAHVSKIAFPNDKLNPIALRGDNSMEIATNKYDWVSTDADWETAIKIADYYAAIEIVDGLPNEDSSKLQEALESIIKKLNRVDSTTSSSSLATAKSINIQNELDPLNYMPTQDKWG